MDLITIQNNDEINFAWIDLETTGFTDLDSDGVNRNKILEVGIALSDKNFDVYATKSIVIHHEREDLNAVMDDVVLNMHTANGLLDDVEKSTVSEADAKEIIFNFLSEHICKGNAPLSGNTIFLDRAFLEARMPQVSRFLHYRNFDVSTLKIFFANAAAELEFQKRSAHRALDDVLLSVQEAKHYMGLVSPFIPQMIAAVAATAEEKQETSQVSGAE